MATKQQNTIIEHMQQHGIKPSVQRIAILNYLLTHYTHPTVDEIYADLSPAMPTLSKTTVYNTLKLFADAGLVLNLNLDEKNQRFDGYIQPHAHFICTNCGKIEDFFPKDELFCLPESENKDIQKVEISYYGLCNTCKCSKKYN